MPAAVQVLVSDYGATRVVLFGSLARDEAGPASDVDLLVEGLDDSLLFDAIAACSRVLGTEADLVPAHRARPSVRARVEQEGLVLHGAR